MKDAVKNIEYFDPIADGDAAGEDNAACLISGTDGLEKQIGLQLKDLFTNSKTFWKKFEKAFL